MTNKEIFAQATLSIQEKINKLKRQKYSSLEEYIEEEESEEVKFGKVSIFFSTWARKEEDGRIGVIVEARRFRILGNSNVTVLGFFISKDNTVVDMEDKDLWGHGY